MSKLSVLKHVAKSCFGLGLGTAVGIMEGAILTIEGPFHECYEMDDYVFPVDNANFFITAVLGQPLLLFNAFIVYPKTSMNIAQQKGIKASLLHFELVDCGNHTTFFAPTREGMRERCDAAERDIKRHMIF